jgi:para-nitrobenzyl esterase
MACVITAGGQTLILHDAPAPTVTVQSGAMAGKYFSSARNEVAFLGIPYAAPPLGELRWKPPQPVNKWKGTRQMTSFGAACPQLPANWFPYIGWNEDCLYLNVWTAHFSATAKLPVIVYFHGGSNTSGYSQMTPLGPILSREGVVVVSANYRLGPFGFLALPALSGESQHHSSGNYGLLDQLQALKWVHENIGQFGGDPSRVTVMGQSAGAVDICLLMSSPMASGLFHGAILESGDCQSGYNEDIRTPIPYNLISGTGEAVGERFANDLRVAVGPDELRQLRSIPADKILQAWSEDRQVHFDAIVDGWVISEQPAEVFAAGKQLHVPVLVGSNANEATVFGHGGPKTVDEYKKYLFEDTGKYSGEEFRIYPARSDAEVPDRYLQLQSDSFAYGAYSMARAMGRVGQKAYLYYFTYAETGKRAALGAYHGEELKFLSDSFPADWEHNRDDEKLGEEMRGYWVEFAKTGNPNVRGNPYWPAYAPHSDKCFELGRRVGVLPIKPELHDLNRIMGQVVTKTSR